MWYEFAIGLSQAIMGLILHILCNLLLRKFSQTFTYMHQIKILFGFETIITFVISKKNHVLLWTYFYKSKFLVICIAVFLAILLAIFLATFLTISLLISSVIFLLIFLAISQAIFLAIFLAIRLVIYLASNISKCAKLSYLLMLVP